MESKQKREYERPAMLVVEIQQRGLLMTSDSVGAKSSINDWGNGGSDNEQIYM